MILCLFKLDNQRDELNKKSEKNCGNEEMNIN